MLDTVNPDAVRAALADPSRTLYIVASKSGTTIEPVSLAAEARRIASAGAGWVRTPWRLPIPTRPCTARPFATGSARCSSTRPTSAALLRPVALRPGAGRADGCRPRWSGGVGAGHGTRVPPSECRRQRRAGTRCPNGDGRGTRARQADAASAAGLRRLRVVGRATGRGEHRQARRRRRADHGGTLDGGLRARPVLRGGHVCRRDDRRRHLGTGARSGRTVDVHRRATADGSPAEFLRWEVATAVAGMVLAVNPFDEPNVKQAKDATNALLDAYVRDSLLPFPEPTRWPAARASPSAAQWLPPAHRSPGRCSTPPRRRLRGAPGLRAAERRGVNAGARRWARRAGAGQRCGDDFRLRPALSPLHGTAPQGRPQYWGIRGGDWRARRRLPVPGQPFSFGILEAAQALGDFQSLDAGGRRAAYIRLSKSDPAALAAVIGALAPPAR